MRRFMIAAAALAFVVAACQLFVDLDDVTGVEPPVPPAPPDGCKHVRVPAKPAKQAGGNDRHDGGPLFFASRGFITLPAGQDPPGFDLDDYCTGDDASTKPAHACGVGATTNDTDFDGGVDNSFSVLLERVRALNDVTATLLSQNASDGFFTVFLELIDYNGLDNDEDVGVAFLSAADPTCDACANGKPSLEAGADTWKQLGGGQTVPDTNLAASALPGYVSNRTLVLDRGDGQIAITLGSGGLLQLSRTTMTAALTRTADGRFELNHVVLGGIAGIRDFLHLAGSLNLTGEGPACKADPLRYGLFRTALCAQRDIRLDLDASMPCDAISFGVIFDTVSANLSSQVLEHEDQCADGGTVLTDCP